MRAISMVSQRLVAVVTENPVAIRPSLFPEHGVKANAITFDLGSVLGTPAVDVIK